MIGPSDAARIRFYHAALSSSLSTLHQAIRAGYLGIYPGFNAASTNLGKQYRVSSMHNDITYINQAMQPMHHLITKGPTTFMSHASKLPAKSAQIKQDSF